MSALTRYVIQSIMACIFTHTIYRTRVPVLFFSLTGPSESEVNTPAGLGTNLLYSTVVNWMEDQPAVPSAPYGLAWIIHSHMAKAPSRRYVLSAGLLPGVESLCPSSIPVDQCVSSPTL
jgi:hypothetical protein